MYLSGTSHLSFRHCLNKRKDFNEDSNELTWGPGWEFKKQQDSGKVKKKKEKERKRHGYAVDCVYICVAWHTVCGV